MSVRINFKQDEFVVYPTHGVGQIKGVETQTVAGQNLELVIISFDHDRLTLRVPMQKLQLSGLRHVSSPEQMRSVLQTLRGKSRVRRTMWARRAQEYETKINSGNPVHIAEVVRDLFRNKTQPEQSYSERVLYQSALNRLAREYAVIEAIHEDEATNKLEEVLVKAA